MNDFLKPEDYKEPTCPLCKPTDGKVTPIDIGRVIDKEDAYLDKNDYDGARRHLEYWLREADAGNDLRGRLAVCNELMGLHRKCANRDEAYKAAENALTALEGLNLRDSITGGTTLVNTATVYKAFGDAEKALVLYEEALLTYLKLLEDNDTRLASLYNNMSLALTDTGDYGRAREYCLKALAIMEKAPQGEAECAITYLNLASLAEEEKGLTEAEEEINGYLLKAKELLDSPALERNGYYAFVCEKCAPSFGYYGYFAYEKILNERSEKIYEGT